MKKNKVRIFLIIILLVLFLVASFKVGSFFFDTHKNKEYNNKLIEVIIKDIADIYKAREDKDYVSKLVTIDDIGTQNYSLSVSIYIDKEDTTEKVDIKILNQQIKEMVQKENELRKAIDEIIEELEGWFYE